MSDLIPTVQPLIDRWERGDFRAPSDLLSPDLVLTGFTATGDDRAEGAEQIAAYLRQFFAEWRDYRIDAQQVTALDGQHVLIEGRQRGIGRASGLEIDETLFVLVAVQDGLVRGIHWHAYRDGAFRAAGLREHG
jgi:ketosteroid isomerase-like protein